MKNSQIDRRDFLKAAAMAGAAAASTSLLTAQETGQASAAAGGDTKPRAFEANFDSLDKRPNPAWFDDDKIGLFITWGVYSVPSVAWVYPNKPYGYGGHSCWYGLYIDHSAKLGGGELVAAEQAKLDAFHRRNYGDVLFKALGPLFKAEAYDPAQWAELFKRSGVRYGFLTSNFHDGYCTWPSPYSPGWNSMEVGPKRDLLGDFCAAMRNAGLRAGFYYSLAEFGHPLYVQAKKLGGDMRPFVRQHLQPQLREAVRRYSPSVIWFDGEWMDPLDSFEMQDFLAWLYNQSACKDEIVVNDRFGIGSRGKHGGYFASEVGVREGGVVHKWSEDRPISRGNWSYNRLERLEDYLSERDLMHLLIETVALGGNLHISISPCADGTLPMLQQERLAQMGEWLKVNGEAIYGTRQWNVATEGPMVDSVDMRLDPKWIWTESKQRPMVHYTRKADAVYAICLAWPEGTLRLEHPVTTEQTHVEMLGRGQRLQWKTREKGLEIEVPRMSVNELPCRNAWVFKLTGLKTA